MVKKLFGKDLKCKNKKQARRLKKIEQKKVEGKPLNSRNGGLEEIPPLGKGEGVYKAPPFPPTQFLPPRKYHGKCVEKQMKKAACLTE